MSHGTGIWSLQSIHSNDVKLTASNFLDKIQRYEKYTSPQLEHVLEIAGSSPPEKNKS